MTLRIFIGTEEKTKIFDQVLEYSIRRHTAEPVEIVRMIGPDWEYPIDGLKVGTGFSLRRWMIPAACGWAGKAIYLDADQLVFGDIGELIQLAVGDKKIWCSWQPDKFQKTPWPQTSVMVIDCAKAQGCWGFEIDKVLDRLRKDPSRKTYIDLMHATWLPVEEIGRFGNEWNHLNTYKAGKTKLIHYTKEDTQPHYCPTHPHAGIWEDELRRAIKAGAVSRKDFEVALGKWNVQEDWRKTNGIHPHYRPLLRLFA